MSDLGVALGLVLVIEGLIWAAFPGLARQLLEALSIAPEQQVRTAGLVALATGVGVVWCFRG